MLNKFRGAILGLAIGDALGMPVEGASREEIKQLGTIKALPENGE